MHRLPSRGGTHFDGRYAYDSTDLSLILTTAEDEVVELMLKGVSHKALAQLEKHSDELSLQRISEPVNTARGQIDKMVRTDVPELRRPWFAEGHSNISSPLFLAIFKAGVVYFTDDSQQSLSCYRQTPLPRQLISIAKGNVFFNDQGAPEDSVPFEPQSIPSDKGRWLSIAGLAITKNENYLLVCDSKLGTIRFVKNVYWIAHHPSSKTSLSKLKVIGNTQRFHPFAIRTGLPRDEQVLITNPVVGVIYLCTLSADYTALTICCTIEGADLIHPIDCLFFADNVIVVTDCPSVGSISSRFVSLRSSPHTTAGSLVYPLYFLTNHREACSNRAGFPVIGQFCHLSIQYGGYQCG